MLRLYVYAVIAVLCSGVLYAGLLPNMVSAKDSFMVIIGVFIALVWPVLLILFFRKKVRKLLKCVKF